jgi:hypothetical protein
MRVWITYGCGSVAARDDHSAGIVAGNHVARAGRGAADQILVGRVNENTDAVAQPLKASDVGADVVALDDVVERGKLSDHDTAAVARDEVAGRGRGAADQVVVGPRADMDPVAIAAGQQAGDVGANQVAFDAGLLGTASKEHFERDIKGLL